MPFKSFFILIFLVLFSFSGRAEFVPLSENATVSILTCGTGNEVYSLFGHTAIRVKDPQRNIDIVYNYGAFDFEAPNFTLRFTKGDLQYFVTSEPFMDFIQQYHYENRSVYEQMLHIPLHKKQELFDKLNSVLASDEKYYTYKFIDRNCTNMAVNLLNETLDALYVIKTRNTKPTYRETLYPYFDGHFYEQLGTSIIFGTKVDQKATLLFLPIEFQESLYTAKYNGKPLSEKGREIIAEKEKKTSGSWWNNVYTYLLILVVIIILNRTTLTFAYLALLGLIGVFFSIAGWYSLHEELANNYNILLFNPLVLLLMLFHITGRLRMLVGTTLFCVLMILAYLVVMMDKIHLLIVMPIVITNLIIFWRIASQGMEKLRA